MSTTTYETTEHEGSAPIKHWTRGVLFEDEARKQLANVARLPFIHKHVAAMPDVHFGIGATVGSVIPTMGAIIPAAVGVDIGCGMMALQTSLTASDLPDNLAAMRAEILKGVPVGFNWHREETPQIVKHFSGLREGFDLLRAKHPTVLDDVITRAWQQMGTLGGGNHFIEVCLDEAQRVWVMLHSGSRGVGNRIGTHFIEQAKRDMGGYVSLLPDEDLAYLIEGTEHFADYVEAVQWAQDYAMTNRHMMMETVIEAMSASLGRPIEAAAPVVACHHNYISREHHFDKNVWVTRKGAVRAREGELGIIPGSMGARSFIVRGKGNAESFQSCSHGAGRAMSRGRAKREITMEQHLQDVAGVECDHDKDFIDESPKAYKDIYAVMSAQADLVDIVHTLKQVLCVKGKSGK